MADIIYTGKNFSQPLQSDGGRSMSRLSDFILKAEELKYNTFKQNEQEFLKNSNIDPAFFISTANQKTQAGLLEAYNQKWSQKMKQSGYNMSMEDKMAMQAEKNLIVSQQNDMLMKQKMWEEEDALVKKYPGEYDDAEHRQKTLDYITTGNFDYTSVPYRALPVADELMKIRGKVGKTTAVTRPLPDRPGYQQTIETTGTREDIAPIIIDRVFNNPRIMKDMMNKWNALPREEKDRRLIESGYDTDKSGTLSPQERASGEALTKSAENPILKYYIDENYKYGVLEEPGGQPQRLPGFTGGTVSKKTVKLAGAMLDLEPGERAGFRTYGGMVYNNPFQLDGTKVVYGVPTANAKGLTGDFADAIEAGSVNVRLVNYDPDKKVFIVDTNTASESAQVGSKTLLEVPQQDIAGYENIPIIEKGRRMTIGELLKSAPTTTQATPKKKFNYVTGKLE